MSRFAPIAAILLAMACSGCHGRKANASKVQNDLRMLAQGLTQYEVDFNRFPDSLNAMNRSFVAKNGHRFGPYVVAIPTDPWGKAYVYRPPLNAGSSPEVSSTGADRREGGGDDIHLTVNSVRLK
jgi:general secretion pathway protein G